MIKYLYTCDLTTHILKVEDNKLMGIYIFSTFRESRWVRPTIADKQWFKHLQVSNYKELSALEDNFGNGIIFFVWSFN